MYKKVYFRCLVFSMLGLSIAGCKVPAIKEHKPQLDLPQVYQSTKEDSTSWASIPWKRFFNDKDLQLLIDTALSRNKELNIVLQEIEIAKSDVAMRKSNLYPKGGLKVGTGVEKVGRYTSQGAGDASTEIEPGRHMPDPLGDFGLVASAHWEVDIWGKLHQAQGAAQNRYLATVEGKNFVLSNLIGEIASSYYELISLDNQIELVNSNITLQQQALEVVIAQRAVGRVNELAVQKFKAELLKTQGLAYKLKQRSVETENRINFLLGRYSQPIARNHDALAETLPSELKVGIPSQILHNRPDVKQAELELQAAELDVKVARAEFYPSLDISAAVGLQAFKPSYLIKAPESMLYSLAGDLFAPLINRGAIQAEFKSATARQLQALYNYEQVVLNAYLEVANQLAGVSNLQQEMEKQQQQVDVLSSAIDISKELFAGNRAEYLEVLTTQRDVLDAKLEALELKKSQFLALINIYKAVGGGWR
ncbi:TolC family protein [Sphingobacterium tabacisoli]|uniref:TolC family protein n=2 Tax=Sphingobacterium tabacisoli TaxID=2044855 RepID=A0ABW5L4D2_9SPHI